MKLKLLTFLLASFSVLLAIWGLGFILFVLSVLNSEPAPKAQKTEAIVALTGGAGRIDTAIELLAQGTSDKLFITGVNPNVTKGMLIKRWKKSTKAKPNKDLNCCIYIDYEAENTEQNAQETQKWVEKHDIDSIRLVTSDYHMTRSYLETKDLLSDVEIYKHPVSQLNKVDSRLHFWHLVFTEYNKTLLIWTRLNHENKN